MLQSERNCIMNKTLLKRVGFLVAATIILFLVVMARQTETQASLDLRTEEVRNMMAFGPYIENMAGYKPVDYSLLENTEFTSYADYQEYGFVKAEPVDQNNYETYQFVLVGDERGSLGAAGYAGLLVRKESLIPCGHVINK